MSEAEILNYITTYADQAHGTQVRKYTGERYIRHPQRVMETVRHYCPQIEVLAAALLHDVLEDTAVTAGQIEETLRQVMPTQQANKTVRFVIELTDIFVWKDFPRMNRRTRKEKEASRLACVSAEAQSIKYADIIDNVKDIVEQDTDFARVFVREAKRMLTVMTAGHPELRARAMALVDRCLLELPSRTASC